MRERADKWILNGKVPEPCLDLLRWARWFETAKRHVGDDTLGDGEIRVSTVFLGLDHNFMSDGPPLLFESMVFGEEYLTNLLGRERLIRDDLEMWRYSTWEQAEEGHRNLVQRYRALLEEARAVVARIANPGTVSQ